MIEIRTEDRIVPAISRDDVSDRLNRVQPAYSREGLGGMNRAKSAFADELPEPRAVRAETVPPAKRRAAPPQPARTSPMPAPRPAVPDMRMPRLECPLRRGQKTALPLRGPNGRLRMGVGWNVRDGRCDIDVSAFMLASGGRVPGDDWFVFYGQPVSPDGSVRFLADGGADREAVTVDLGRLDPAVERIVFVMTINEAHSQRLNFGMVREAYLRVMDDDAGRELVSYALTDFFENVTSMTLGELYLHKGAWKFNPVGNGVGLDLAGQCAVYGVEIGG